MECFLLSGRATGTGEAGSTAWNAAVRSRLYLTEPEADDGQDPEPNRRILATKKANYAGKDLIDLEWRDGVFVSVGETIDAVSSTERGLGETTFTY